MKNVLLLGYDGYIGWALLQRLSKDGYNVVAIDDGSRRYNVEDVMNSFSATPILNCYDRIKSFKNVTFYETNVSIIEDVMNLKKIKFDTIINLAHQPSGPFSQLSQSTGEYTLWNNYIHTHTILDWIKRKQPQAHYITIGSTGEYDHNLDIPIEEGYFTLPNASKESIFPRRTNSVYHCSKIANTYLIDTLSRMWKIKSTDIQQAVVFGAYTDEIDESKNYTRFDSDAAFGTVANKFCLQAVLEQPLTIYGSGDHNRGFICLNDSIQALMIAIENDKKDDFHDDYRPRVWNQLSFWLSINELANKVKDIGKDFGLDVKTEYVGNPRQENTNKPKHYSYKTNVLESYGYKPTMTINQEINYVIKTLLENKDNILELKKNSKTNIKFE